MLPLCRFPLVLLLAGLVVALGACRQPSTPDPQVTTAQDTASAPAVAAPDTAAIDLRKASSAEVLAFTRDGNAPLTILNFWATWCVPCIIEFPALVQAEEALKAEGVRLTFVSADDLTARIDVLTFLAQHGVRGTAFLKNEPDDAFIGAFSKTWSGTLPATFLFDRAGRPLAFFDRPVTFEAIMDTARALLRTRSL